MITPSGQETRLSSFGPAIKEGDTVTVEVKVTLDALKKEAEVSFYRNQASAFGVVSFEHPLISISTPIATSMNTMRPARKTKYLVHCCLFFCWRETRGGVPFPSLHFHFTDRVNSTGRKEGRPVAAAYQQARTYLLSFNRHGCLWSNATILQI